jgi:hypothetical protein
MHESLSVDVLLQQLVVLFYGCLLFHFLLAFQLQDFPGAEK